MKTITWMLPALVFIVGCAAINVGTDHDPDADFAVYKTFDWHQEVTNYTAQRLNKWIRDAVASNLEAHGMKQADQPDLKVAYSVLSMDDVSRVSATVGYGYWRGTGQTNVDYYKEGSLILELIDVKTNQVVWQGWARTNVTDLEDSEQRVQKVVKNILARYPPAPAN